MQLNFAVFLFLVAFLILQGAKELGKWAKQGVNVAKLQLNFTNLQFLVAILLFKKPKMQLNLPIFIFLVANTPNGERTRNASPNAGSFPTKTKKPARRPAFCDASAPKLFGDSAYGALVDAGTAVDASVGNGANISNSQSAIGACVNANAASDAFISIDSNSHD